MVDARRADALRNRERILEIAYPAFAADPAVSLNQIAKLAGVGAGTLYRHFPSREALILALYEREVTHLADEVDTVLGAHPGAPLEAFREWFRRLAGYVRVKHGLGEALNTPAAQETIDGSYAPVLRAVDRLLTVCEEAGDVRPGLDRSDVLLAMGFLWRVDETDAGLEQAERITDLFVEGLRRRSLDGGKKAGHAPLLTAAGEFLVGQRRAGNGNDANDLLPPRVLAWVRGDRADCHLVREFCRVDPATQDQNIGVQEGRTPAWRRTGAFAGSGSAPRSGGHRR